MENKESPKSLSDEIKNPGADYNPNAPKIPGEIDEKAKKEIDKTKEKLESFKKAVLKKFPFTLAMGIIPPQAAERFDEEMGLTPEEKKEKPMHLTVIIPEENFKEIAKIRAEVIKEAKDMKPKLWINVITPVDLANYCLDSKYDIVEAIAMSYPLHDKGILGTYRVSSIHKSLVLRKFEKYIYSYVIGGSLVRGEGKPTSDIDAYIIIDDTDVKRMPRLELKEKLRGIIYQYVAEAAELSGVKTVLHVQVYLLTEFWESVKDASPVIFGFIRDGIPLYDRGGFLPWKLLLKMGKIKPSPESIDHFMAMGDKTKEIVKNRLLDIVIGDLFWSVSAPTQAVLMLYGIPPPNIHETVKEMQRIFVDEEKMLEQKYVDILEDICIHYYKGFEHGKIKEITGTEVDKLMKDADDYMKRLKELHLEIEKRAQDRTLKDTYDNVFSLLKKLFGNKSEAELVKQFEKDLVNKGGVEVKQLHIINEILDIKKKQASKKKPTKYEVEDVRKNASYLINSLTEYGQRCEMQEIKKMQVKVKYKEKGSDRSAELYLTSPTFIVAQGKILRAKGNKLEESNQQEFDGVIFAQKSKPSSITAETLEAMKKEFGEFDLIV